MSILDNLPEDEERALYNSAISVKRSEFWKYYIEKINEIIEMNKEEAVNSILVGDDKRSMLSASKARGLELAKEEIDNIINELATTALNQEQEDENA